MDNYIFFDFDGVLFDTLREAYIICRYAYEGTDYFKPVDNNTYNSFYKYKFLVYNSWQYYYLMKVLTQEPNEKEFLKKYNQYINNRDFHAEKEFDKRYYAAREDLMTNHHDFWDTLESPFNITLNLREKINNNSIHPVIVSKKNKDAISYRFSQYNIKISSFDIYGKNELEKYKTKAEFIKYYMDKYNISKAYFIDDNSNNLKPCEKYKQIIPILAGWGNIAIGEKGYTQEDVLNLLK